MARPGRGGSRRRNRGRLSIGNGVCIADAGHVYPHDHGVLDRTEVTAYHTVLEDDVRLGVDALIRAGSRVGENAVVGAKAVLQGDVPVHHVAVGTPADSIRVKPGFEDVAAPVEAGVVDRREERVVEYDHADVGAFDEFERELDPAG